ncbi:MAG: precorrin-6Y C5,15-methyltransferase (decarboxylating) subunit CbiT [Lachnospiraceae bacterium]|nr:precorrin-6Y C5,15-methyltransferase (decarboxylating) subunit CbiT [Lachnospiraceae bacterium]
MSGIKCIKDSEFVRGNVPMTKEEIRMVSLSKLQADDNSIIFDIGAGTGSVSVNQALNTPKASIFAFERDGEAIDLIEKNIERFGVKNVHIVYGNAPDSFKGVPVPTHAFIGGSGGRLHEIVYELINLNPDIHIVFNGITLENTAAMLDEIREHPEFSGSGIVQLSVSRARKANALHMMQGENPVYIIDMRK